MSTAAEQQSLAPERRTSRAALLVVVAAALSLVGAGLLLWARHGTAVFADTILTALAWCF